MWLFRFGADSRLTDAPVGAAVKACATVAPQPSPIEGGYRPPESGSP